MDSFCRISVKQNEIDFKIPVEGKIQAQYRGEVIGLVHAGSNPLLALEREALGPDISVVMPLEE